MQKRVLAVSDISCLGKCALTTALPVLSACGHECVLLPTAVLSTHTAADFGDYTCEDLTHRLLPILQHWQRLGITFDAVYIGYLTTSAQAALLEEQLPKLCREDTLWLVDPILGDNGQLYRGLSAENIAALRRLCQRADIITPNLTEAALLTGLHHGDTADDLLAALQTLTNAQVLLTGVPFDGEQIGILSRDKSGAVCAHANPHINAMLHGTGDLVASAALGAYLCGVSLTDAATVAADFVAACIKRQQACPDGRWYGLPFEQELGMLKQGIDTYK